MAFEVHSPPCLGGQDFDGATMQAQRMFHSIFPGEAFLPALPEPESGMMQGGHA